MKKLLLLLFLLLSPLFAASSVIVELEIKGAIGPASSEYLKGGIETAVREDAEMILVKLDTPGGLSTSMREMIQDIANSHIPVVMYVYPKGARAASAGTYLMYASNVAAMAPGTNIGAATPISLIPSHPATNEMSAPERKAVNDAAAYIKSLAELNGRNVPWALDAVKNAKSITAKEALKLGVIEYIAENPRELIAMLNNKTVKVSNNTLTLNTQNSIISKYEPDWKTKFLYVITNPNIAYILLLIAVYGIFFELMNPGAVLPGVIGTISGVVALYSLNMIPFNFAGLFLIILGIAFMIIEVFVAGFGVLGIGGVVSFAFGSLLLFDAKTLGNSVSVPLVIAFSLVSLAFFIMVVKLFLKARSAKVVSGAEEMIGSFAEVVDVGETGYRIMSHGELWNAVSREKLKVGQNVQVVGLNGLTLRVEPTKE
ncbi:nodulation protein NfeD [Sulfurimonas sp. HSL-1716]|uniref:NfeD family protein n=1 Tax=Hydrocurvibacter sulfurireducens TaxID=3131937 RepID=UPI0031F73DF5